MCELLDFDKDLIHLEAASKVLQLAKILHFWVKKSMSLNFNIYQSC
jgi:hypothetical protein